MKILMTLMGLEIGGAETHVVELCRELASRGVDVTVASNGGVYEKTLAECNIKHVKLPLHTKTPSAMLESYRGLKKLIKTEKFDIVHAHARIPAFICGLLAKQLHFRFITSTHGVYKVDPLLSVATDWGERAVAVSCDIKQYLIDSYGFPSDNVSITINGIDTGRFSKNIDSSAERREFSLTDDKFRITYVSRIDTEAALTGFLLCDAAEKLSTEIPALEILMVGGGTAFERLSERAAKVNKKLGGEVIKLTGARTDVAELISACDCFAGVSRAALEAMSMEKPVILAGAQGYIGILNEDNLALAESTNFCCRGEKLPTADDIASDIKRLFEMSKAEREVLGSFGRRVILEGYSVARMADDYLAAYAKMTPYEPYKRGDIIISGYYGFDNMGDDSLLSSMIDGIKKNAPDARITVLSNSPDKTSAVCGVRCVNRFNIPAVAREMRGAKLLISGGGSLLQDGTSRKSLYYYVTIMKMAKKRGLKLMLYANGLGPLVSDKSRSMAAEIIKAADYVSLREKRSELLAEELGIGSLKVTADPAFLLEPASDEWIDHIKRRESISRPYFIVSIKDGNNFGERSRPELIDFLAADIAALAVEHSMTPVFIPMHPGKDGAITRELCQKVGQGKVISGLTAAELCGLLRDAGFAVGMRLHMLIFAARMGVPMVGISYDPKIDAFLEYLGEGKSLDVRTITAGELYSAASELLKDRGARSERIKSRSAELRELALTDCEATVKLCFDNKNNQEKTK